MSQEQIGSLLWTAPRSAYLPGEIITRELKAVDGEPIGPVTFHIETSPGSGFAGQVYRAVPQESIYLPPVVAVKVLRPRSQVKLWLRDLMFQICFQTSYAPRLREDAVQTGLIWQSILRAAVKIEMGSDQLVTQPFGYFWDPGLASFAEVHEWIDGRPARSEPDEYLLARLFHRPHPPDASEMARKKRFMDRLTGLCRQIGATGLTRQFEWWTCVSQDNVLTRKSPVFESDAASGESNKVPRPMGEEFCAVDCRPGLAIPFFGFFSPAHAQMILEGLRRGVWVHFDETNFDQLQAFLSRHASLRNLQPLINHLQDVESRYKSGLPNLWHSYKRVFREKGHLHNLRMSAARDLILLGQIAPECQEKFSKSPLSLQILLLTNNLPVFGPWITRLAAHPDYRRHLNRLFTKQKYRTTVFQAWQSLELPYWLAEGRINAQHRQNLQDKLGLYILEKIFFGWLPISIHRLLTDRQKVKDWIDSLFFQPLRILLDRTARTAWLDTILAAQYQRGMIPPELYQIHRGQIREPRMQGYIRDLSLTASLDVFSRLVYLLLSVYGISTNDFLPLGLAILSPIPPSGPIRVLYLLVQLVLDPGRARLWGQPVLRVLQARIAALFIAPWRWIGNFSPLVEISAFYTRLSFLLSEYIISQAAEKIPVFGGQGKLLEYAVFQLFYNLPLSLRHEMRDRFIKKTPGKFSEK